MHCTGCPARASVHWKEPPQSETEYAGAVAGSAADEVETGALMQTLEQAPALASSKRLSNIILRLDDKKMMHAIIRQRVDDCMYVCTAPFTSGRARAGWMHAPVTRQSCSRRPQVGRAGRSQEAGLDEAVYLTILLRTTISIK